MCVRDTDPALTHRTSTFQMFTPSSTLEDATPSGLGCDKVPGSGSGGPGWAGEQQVFSTVILRSGGFS